MFTLKDKVAIVTGASAGIGRATAMLFAEHGARVVVAARRENELKRLVDDISRLDGQAVYRAGDITQEDFARSLVDLAESHFGGLDIAFNNAGILGETAPIAELSVAGWEEALRTNLTSAFLAARYQVPAMRRRGGGALIFTSSFVGYTVGFPGMSAYAASKSGLIGLTRALAAELGSEGIRVNALLPGGTDTDMVHRFAQTPEVLAAVRNMHALKRLAVPREIAHAALFLASSAASFSTGAALLVDGGVSISRG